MNKILEGAEFVTENSRFVSINENEISDFSKDCYHADTKHWLSIFPMDFSGFSDEEKLHFLAVLDTLSFCYWREPKWAVEYEGEKYDGARGLVAALMKAYKEKKPILDFGHLAKIEKEEFREILRGENEIPLFEERWKCLREISSVISEKYGGSFDKFIKAGEGDAQKIINLIISEFSSFRDVSKFQNKEIQFLKRAQLLISDIHQIFGGDGYGNIKNIEQLTACADYKLPQALRKVEILEYGPELSEKVDNEIEIPHDSQEEIEIRANTIWAVELIRREMEKEGRKMSAMEINDHLWLMTQKKSPDDLPYHRTETIYY